MCSGATPAARAASQFLKYTVVGGATGRAVVGGSGRGCVGGTKSAKVVGGSGRGCVGEGVGATVSSGPDAAGLVVPSGVARNGLAVDGSVDDD